MAELDSNSLELLERFEAIWSGVVAEGTRPSLSEYLPAGVPTAALRSVFRDLLQIELRHRHRLEEQPSLDEYIQRLPQFESQLRQLFGELAAPPSCTDDRAGTTATLRPRQPGSGQQPDQIGPYRIEKILGQGSFGTVYLGYDAQLDRRVAIKILTTDDAFGSLREEAKNLASLEHPAILRVLHFDVADNQFYVVTEYIEGGDLKQRMEAQRYPQQAAARLIQTLALALHTAHKRGIVHRDLKPANILLDEQDAPHIADFGIALNRNNYGQGPQFVGSVPYMSPEQARYEGHRVDGQSDIYSLGAILYELLVNERPSRGHSIEDYLDCIINVDPIPPRQIDDRVARELERICLKCLAKRKAERYTCAQDLADDLRDWLSNQSQAAPDRLTIIPKGLQPYDSQDADFFLRLLPGPFDKHGLPEEIRFWKSRIEASTALLPFSVGVIYGPSGCGKSSIIRAGLLPRLDRDVTPIYIESNASHTAETVKSAILRRFPDLSPEPASLAELFRELRSSIDRSSRKVLFVIDQFERYLHGRSETGVDLLVDALRQCDGKSLQCLLVVREDFWLSLKRFMRALEISVQDGDNSMLIDLFNSKHTARVLELLGRAYGCLKQDARALTAEQTAFIREAVEYLASDGRSYPVQIALFVEMLRDVPWHKHSLAQIGGASGVGLAFLDQHFAPNQPRALYRHYHHAVMAVLSELLPDSGIDVRLTSRCEPELQRAAGLTDRPEEFKDLMHILIDELRLISPIDDQSLRKHDHQASSETRYQLTHDYLLHSIRRWIARNKAKTRSGRAELLLVSRTQQWKDNPDRLTLPTIAELISIWLFTSPAGRTEQQSQLVRAAVTYYGTRIGAGAVAILAVLAVVGFIARGQLRDQQARAAVEQLMSVPTSDVIRVANQVRPDRDHLADLLAEKLAHTDSQDRRLRLYALTPAAHQLEIFDRLISFPPPDAETFQLIQNLLAPRGLTADQQGTLRAMLDDPSKSSRQQFVAAAALLSGKLPQHDARVFRRFLHEFVQADRSQRADWIQAMGDALLPVKQEMLGVIEAGNVDRSPQWQRTFDVLSESFGKHPDVHLVLIRHAADGKLASLLPVTDPELQLALRSGLETSQQEWDASYGEMAAAEELSQQTQQQLMNSARQYANQFVALLVESNSLDADRESEPPIVSDFATLRGQTLHCLLSNQLTMQLPLLALLSEEQGVAMQRLALHTMGQTVSSASPIEDVIQRRVYELYLHTSDPGVHSAAEQVLRRLQIDLSLAQTKLLATTPPPSSPPAPRRFYYDPRAGSSFITFPAVKTVVGSPAWEPFRESDANLYDFYQPGGEWKSMSSERQRATELSPFAIASCEVTVQQYKRLVNDYVPNVELQLSNSEQDPAHGVSWLAAGRYCNLLSQEAGLEPAFDESQARYDLSKFGYRLPTGDEWEYAARGGTAEVRSCGLSRDALGHYSWFARNSWSGGYLPVGSLVPNDYGLFDTLGNVAEWSTDRARVAGNIYQIARGGSYNDSERLMRSAVMLMLSEDDGPSVLGSVGFRLCRTIANEGKSDGKDEGHD